MVHRKEEKHMKKLVKPVASNNNSSTRSVCVCSNFCYGNPRTSNYQISKAASITKTVAVE